MWYFQKSRRQREKDTVESMIRIYCRAKHGAGDLCESCNYLVTYTGLKQNNCPFGENKPVCSLCHVHCYRHEEREKIKTIMRFAGPRMLLLHPLMAIDHMILKNKYLRMKKK